MNNIFNETTIILSIFKDRELEKKIRKFISDNNFDTFTASYCIMESLNILMPRITYLISKIKQFNSLTKALSFITNALGPQKTAEIKWSFNLINYIYGKDEQECTERAICSLSTLKLTCSKLITNHINHIENKLECNIYKHNLKENIDEITWDMPKCKSQNIKCKIIDFFNDNINIIKDIKKLIDDIRETSEITNELEGFSKVIDSASIDPSILCDYKRGCSKFADVLISLESKEIKNFFTQNFKESNILCKALKQKMFKLSNNFLREIELVNFDNE